MSPALRLVLAVFAGCFVAVLATVPIAAFVGSGWLGALLQPLLSIGAGVLAGRSIWRQLGDPRGGRFAAAGVGALVVGGIGFAAGFFGPMLFAPEANQGPMLGIFITGPGGAVLGAIGGFLLGSRRPS
jgi:hypothetical protein